MFKCNTIKIKGLKQVIKCKAFYFNPRTGKVDKDLEVKLNEDGDWIMTIKGVSSNPSFEDQVLVVENI